MTRSCASGSRARALVHHGLLAWLSCSLVGAGIVALPDDGNRVFSLSTAHGPSVVDLLGVVVMLAGWAVFVTALWRTRDLALRRRASGPALLGGVGVGLVVASVSDWPYWWLVGALLAAAAQLALAAAVFAGPAEAPR